MPGRESRLPSLLSCLCHFRGAWRHSPYLLYSHPATFASWLALATGSSLASTQTRARACPSGRLSLATQGPPGPGSRSGQSPPSPSQMASLLIALRPPLAPDPRRPQLGQDLVWGVTEKPSFRRRSLALSRRGRSTCLLHDPREASSHWIPVFSLAQ